MDEVQEQDGGGPAVDSNEMQVQKNERLAAVQAKANKDTASRASVENERKKMKAELRKELEAEVRAALVRDLKGEIRYTEKIALEARNEAKELVERETQLAGMEVVRLRCLGLRALYSKIIPTGEGKWRMLRFSDGMGSCTQREFDLFVSRSKEFRKGEIRLAKGDNSLIRNAPTVTRGPGPDMVYELAEVQEANPNAKQTAASDDMQVEIGSLIE